MIVTVVIVHAFYRGTFWGTPVNLFVRPLLGLRTVHQLGPPSGLPGQKRKSIVWDKIVRTIFVLSNNIYYFIQTAGAG